MKHTYTVSSEDGADFARRMSGELHESGDEVELELDKEQELALLAAGWLEKKDDKKKK